jgi:ribosomal protein L44E
MMNTTDKNNRDEITLCRFCKRPKYTGHDCEEFQDWARKEVARNQRVAARLLAGEAWESIEADEL